MSNNTRLAELMNYITIDTTSGNQLQMNGSIKQTSVTSALLKADSTGVMVAATAGTDYLTSVGISNIVATGTPSSTTYLRGDGTWATVTGGSGTNLYNADGTLTSNRTISSGGFTLTIAPVTTFSADTFINGIKVGKGNNSITTNTALGVNTLNAISTGAENTGIGNGALAAITSGGYNTAVGNLALNVSSTDSYNTAIGRYAMRLNNGGNSNTAVGFSSSENNVSGVGNTSIGYASMVNATTGNYNVIIGLDAARLNASSSNLTNISSSVVIGYQAKPLSTSGDTNQIIIGYQSIGLGSNTTVIGNASTLSARYYGATAIRGTTLTDDVTYGSELATTGSGTNWSGTGFSTGYTHTAGSTAALTTTITPISGGYYKIKIDQSGGTVGNAVVTFGTEFSKTIYYFSGVGSYVYVKIIGTTSLTVTPTTDFNGTISISILKATANSTSIFSLQNSSGTNIVDFRANTTNNLYIGKDAGLTTSTIASGNVGVGYQALNAIGDSSWNTAIGTNALSVNYRGNGNTAIGWTAMQSSTLGSSWNTAVGQSALTNINGTFNTGIGSNVMYGATSSTASYNTAVGADVLSYITSGSYNAAVGHRAMQNSTTGGSNVAIGAYAGNYYGTSTSLTDSNNSIFIGYYTKSSADSQTNQIVIGYQTVGLGSNTTIIGNSSTTLTALYGSLITGGTSANASAQLQIDSTTKGVLFPRMTTTQKNAISTPAAGLVVYDTDLGKLCVRTASAWETITSA